MSARVSSRQRAPLREAVRTLHPGYFAAVMATSIVSVGVLEHGPAVLSTALMWLAAGGYLVLLVLSGWRLAAFPAEVRQDLSDPARGFGFFTFVAGTNLLGARLSLDGHGLAATVLLVVGGLAWLLLGYLVPWKAVLGRTRPAVPGANGTWFIWVVATQSVAVLAATLQPGSAARRELALLALFSWSVGVILLVTVGLLVVARLVLHDVRPAELGPSYWVAMGATAITVLAGVRIAGMAGAPVVAPTRALVTSASVVLWAVGTWLVPALVAAAWWRHVTHRLPLRYEPTWWDVVFPLGMYGVAAHLLGKAEHLSLVGSLGRYELWLAAAAWVGTLVAMLVQIGHSAHRRRDR